MCHVSNVNIYVPPRCYTWLRNKLLHIFKINDTQALEAYLRKERITYEIYQEERKIISVGKRKHHDDALLPNKKQKSLKGK